MYLDPFGSGSGSGPIIRIRIRILQKGSDPFGSGSGSTILPVTSVPDPDHQIIFTTSGTGFLIQIAVLRIQILILIGIQSDLYIIVPPGSGFEYYIRIRIWI